MLLTPARGGHARSRACDGIRYERNDTWDDAARLVERIVAWEFVLVSDILQEENWTFSEACP